MAEILLAEKRLTSVILSPGCTSGSPGPLHAQVPPKTNKNQGLWGVKSSIFYKSSPGDANVLPELRASGLGELSGKNEYLCRNRVRRNAAVSSWGEKVVAFELLVEEDLDIENWAQWREACSR